MSRRGRTPGQHSLAQEWVQNCFQRYNEAPTERNPSGPAVIADQLDMAKDDQGGAYFGIYDRDAGTWNAPIVAALLD